jgi:hypothetical protein
MFRHGHRRSAPFSDFINWTDYRWDASPRQGVTGGPQPWARPSRGHRDYSFLQVFLAGLAVVVGLKLISALKDSASRNRRNRSWPERAVLAILLIAVASYVSRQRRPL